MYKCSSILLSQEELPYKEWDYCIPKDHRCIYQSHGFFFFMIRYQHYLLTLYKQLINGWID